MTTEGFKKWKTVRHGVIRGGRGGRDSRRAAQTVLQLIAGQTKGSSAGGSSSALAVQILRITVRIMNPAPQTAVPRTKLEEVGERLHSYEQRYRDSARRWKVWYRFFLVMALFMSATAAVIGKLDWRDPKRGADLAAISAGFAAILTAVIGGLDFESNWRVNRRSRHEVTHLLLEAAKATADPDKLLSDLQAVVARRSEAVSDE
jgi:hypothetical protein